MLISSPNTCINGTDINSAIKRRICQIIFIKLYYTPGTFKITNHILAMCVDRKLNNCFF